MLLKFEISGMGTRPYPLDRERRRRVMIALAEKEMTISALARSLGLQQSLVSMIICGRRISEKTEKQIADFLEKSEEYLFPRRSGEEIAQMRQAEAAAKGKAA